MKLFTNDGSSYFRSKHDSLQSEIENFSDEKIINADFNAYIEYFYSKYEVAPIIFYSEYKTKDMREIKIERRDSDFRYRDMGHGTYTLDAFQIDHIIPFDGNSMLFDYSSSTRILTSFNGDIKEPRGESLGTLTLSFQYESSELQRATDVNGFVEQEFKRDFENYVKMVGYINCDARSYNQNLKDCINDYLEKRKSKASKYLSFRSALNIPLKINPNAPNVTPIPLKREVRIPMFEPKAKPLPQEYKITDADYINIKHVIDLSASSMEKTAATHYILEEEQLRDIMLATIESHYMATGETFRKVGKTDIQIQFDNKAAYIAECKIWHGIKAFDGAVSQLFSYATWRDTKISIIIFNKENKDFTALLSTISQWVNEHTVSPKKEAVNIWQCIIIKPETTQKYDVNIAVYDLHV